MNIKTFKLINGEEIIATVIVEALHYLECENPVVLQSVHDPASGKTIRAFGDWPALADPGQPVKIYCHSLVTAPLTPHEELERQYISNVTGLELPPTTPQILLS